MNRDHPKLPLKNLSGIKHILKLINKFRILKKWKAYQKFKSKTEPQSTQKR